MRVIRRRSDRMKPEREASRWLIQLRKESPAPQMRKEFVDEPPLIVPKVIKQYTRKKKVLEPVDTVSAPAGGAAVCSEQNVLTMEVDKKSEEYNPDFNILKEDVKNHVKMEEPDVLKNNAMKEENPVKIKQEQLTEIEFLITNNAQTSDSSKVKGFEINEENLSELVSIDSNVREEQKQKPKRRVEVTIKLEQPDDYEDTDSDQKNTADGHSEEGKTVEIKPKTECDSYSISDEMDEIMIEASVTGQTFHSQYKTLLTEEFSIKEEIVSDNDDNEIAVTSNITEEPADIAVTGGEQATGMAMAGPRVGRRGRPGLADVWGRQTGDVEKNQIKERPKSTSPARLGITSGSQVVTGEIGVVLKTYGKKPTVIPLDNCYLLAVNVAPDTSMSAVRRKPKALLAAKAKKIVNPKDLAGLQVVAKTQIFGCDMCGKDFFSKIGLGRHMSSAHSVATRFVCPCGEKFTHNFLLLAHMKTHTGTITCDICPKRFKTTTKYSYHLNTHLKERFFSCPICVRRYTVLSNLQRHAATHKQSETFECNACCAEYRCITDLRRHSEREHGEKVEYPCYVCSETLHSNAELLAHVNSHDNTIHKCAFCARGFTDVLKWEEHSATHIERLDAIEPVLRPHVCGVCNKRFDYRSVLKTHMKSHAPERPYKCRLCSKTFKTQSAVSEHEKGHNRPYFCPECPARFAKGNSLSRHVLLHSGEKPHACAHCARRFTQRSAMLQHVGRFHIPGLKRARRGRNNVKRK